MADVLVEPDVAVSYRALWKRPGMPRILLTQLLAPLATETWSVAIVLLALYEFDSPALAGSIALLNQIGMVVVPVGGALIDRHGEKRLVLADCFLSAAILTLIAALSLSDMLGVPLFVLLVVVGGMTTHIGGLGIRTAITTDVPDEMLDRTNAVLFSTRAFTRLIGPFLAGMASTLINPEAAIFVAAALYLATVLTMVGYGERTVIKDTTVPLWEDTKESVTYIYENPMIRRITGFVLVAFVGWGAFYTGMPIMVERGLGGSELLVATGFGVFALADIFAGIVFGRIDTRGREWMMLSGAAVLAGCGLLLMSTASTSGLLVGAAMIGAGETPVDATAYSARQRYALPDLVGRMMAMAIAIDCAACALGMALVGFLAEISPSLGLFSAGVLVLIGSLIPAVFIRGRELEPDDFQSIPILNS